VDTELNLDSKINLNDGNKLPAIGLGVARLSQGLETENAVHWALDAGYRHIDTASFYGNEVSVGKAVIEHNINRKDVWITTKLWPTDFISPKKALTKSLERLGLEYVDLYLIHWPPPVDIPGLDNRLWKAMEGFKEEGLCKSIGISNFAGKRLERLVSSANTPPAVNQIECSPLVYPESDIDLCDYNAITVVGYRPLRMAENLNNQTLQKIAQKHSKSPAQIMLRWALQKGIVPIPKSKSRDRIQENIDIFDFELSNEDLEELKTLSVAE